mmetsp:Transcript_31239/g.72850  ORF Transcript_31239/g.72850 Transcript_31239/m.72850 type:complete len:347 (+) Transcript_31239:158-1198(+)
MKRSSAHTSLVVLMVELILLEQLLQLHQRAPDSHSQGAANNAFHTFWCCESNCKSRSKSSVLQVDNVVISFQALLAVLGVAVPNIEDLVVVQHAWWQRRITLPVYTTSTSGCQPSSELDAALVDLVGCVGNLLEFLGFVPVAEVSHIAEVLLLVMEKHCVLMQEEGCGDMLQPDGNWTGEHGHGILVNDTAVACDGVGVQHQESYVPGLAWHCGSVVNGEDNPSILLILHEAWWPEVKNAGDASSGAASVSAQLSPSLHIEPLGVSVAVASHIVMGDQKVSWIHGILKEDIPTQVQVTKVGGELDPLLAELWIMQLLNERRLLLLALFECLLAILTPHKQQSILHT